MGCLFVACYSHKPTHDGTAQIFTYLDLDSGSCWAFAAVASMESNILMKGGAALDLSEQQVLNCNPYGNSAPLLL